MSIIRMVLAGRSGSRDRLGRAPAATHIPLLQPPPDLRRATTPGELAALMPSSYPIARFRRRSIEARGIRVSYKPRPGEVLGGPAPAPPEGPCAPPPPRSPSDSYLEVILPFASSPTLRDEYERFQMGRVRMGLVLEDIDSFAADIAARHLYGAVHGFSIVTAGMDRLQLVTHEQHLQQLRLGVGSSGGAPDEPPPPADGCESDSGGPDGRPLPPPPRAPTPLDAASREELQRAVVGGPGDAASGGPLLIDNDLRLAGCVTWVGRSSLEVTIELADRPAPPHGSAGGGGGEGAPDGDEAPAAAGGWRRRGVAHFILVARGDPRYSGVATVPVAAAGCEEEELLAQGAARQEARRLKRAAEAAAAAAEAAGGGAAGPDALLLQRLVARARQHQAEQWQQQHGGSSGGAAGDGVPAAVPMGATALRTPVIMHHQDRNITNAVFGGHILRSAYEAAYATAALHAGVHPEPLSMSDITFKQPVTVGSIVEFDAKVVLTHGDLMRVSVQAIKHEPAVFAAGRGVPPRAQQALTTVFSFLFAAPPGAVVVPVRPDSLADAADWLVAARQHAEEGYSPPPIAAWGPEPRPRW
ncbi:MAG: hypothetical protein J3K34DRAFT_527607 [Monoraphidium minutum]|nr:MAG: hypothetical protein J3K34DRAFT_527607 [Monoraphidium minutum]